MSLQQDSATEAHTKAVAALDAIFSLVDRINTSEVGITLITVRDAENLSRVLKDRGYEIKMCLLTHDDDDYEANGIFFFKQRDSNKSQNRFFNKN